MTNCINCGAPMHGYICEYCGTDFGFPEERLRKENDFIEIKMNYLHDQTTIQKFYEDALRAMRRYRDI